MIEKILKDYITHAKVEGIINDDSLNKLISEVPNYVNKLNDLDLIKEIDRSTMNDYIKMGEYVRVSANCTPLMKTKDIIKEYLSI